MKKLVLLLAAAAMLFASCGGASTDASTSESWSKDKEYTVTMGVFGDLMPSYEAIIASAEFKAAFPNVTLEFVESDWEGHHSRLVTVITAGEKANDIEVIDEGYVGTFTAGGGFADLAPFGAVEDGKDLAQFALKNATSDKGEVIALPVDIAPVVMFYRADLAEAAGVDFDSLANWAEWLDAARAVSIDTDADGSIDQFALATAQEMAVVTLNNGVGAWHDDNGELLEPKAKFIDILEAVKTISDENLHGNFAEWSDPWIAAYSQEAKGAAVCALNGAWFEGSLKGWMAPDMAGKYRVAKLPGGAAANMGGSFLGVPNTTEGEMRSLSYDIVKFFTTNPKAQIINLVEIGAMPALTSVYDAPEISEELEYFGGQKAREIYVDVATSMPAVEPTEFDQLARGAWLSAVTSIIEEGISAEEAYKIAYDQIKILSN